MSRTYSVGSSHILAAQLPIVADINMFADGLQWCLMLTSSIKWLITISPYLPMIFHSLLVHSRKLYCVGQLSSVLDDQSPIPQFNGSVSKFGLPNCPSHETSIFPTETPSLVNIEITTEIIMLLVGKSTINHHFHSYVSHYQRVSEIDMI